MLLHLQDADRNHLYTCVEMSCTLFGGKSLGAFAPRYSAGRLACRCLSRLGAHAYKSRRTLDAGHSEPLLAESTLAAFGRRWCIRHRDKLVLAACCGLCISTPSAVGTLLLCGVLAATLALRGPGCAENKRVQLARTLWKAASSALVGMWALAQYGACLSDTSLHADPNETVKAYIVLLGEFKCRVRICVSFVSTCGRRSLMKGA